MMGVSPKWNCFIKFVVVASQHFLYMNRKIYIFNQYDTI